MGASLPGDAAKDLILQMIHYSPLIIITHNNNNNVYFRIYTCKLNYNKQTSVRLT